MLFLTHQKRNENIFVFGIKAIYKQKKNMKNMEQQMGNVIAMDFQHEIRFPEKNSFLAVDECFLTTLFQDFASAFSVLFLLLL